MSAPTGNLYVDAVIQVLGGVAAVLNIAGVIGLLFLKTQYKKALARHQHALDVKFAAHEASLRSKHEKEVELLRSELLRVASERQLRFSTVYQKREEILRELYAKLGAAIDACDEAHHVGKRDLVEPAQRKLRQLHSEMESVAIYFEESFCKAWHEHIEALATNLGQLKFAGETQTANWEEDRRLLAKAFDDYIAAWRGIKIDLRKEIRKLIGIENA